MYEHSCCCKKEESKNAVVIQSTEIDGSGFQEKLQEAG